MGSLFLSDSVKSSQGSYKGLHILRKNAFPKQCVCCGNLFKHLKEFLKNTQQVSTGSGLMEYKISSCLGCTQVVALYRNCVCGSTLLVFCKCRRNTSSLGLRRKELFGQMWEQLKERGISHPLIRNELLRVVHGKQSKLLTNLGIDYSEFQKIAHACVKQQFIV